MKIINSIRKKVSGEVTVHETTEGHGDFPQKNLPGDKTLIIEVSGIIGNRKTMYFAVSGDTAYIPNAWAQDDNRLTPHSDEKIIDILTQEGYNVETTPFFKDKFGDYMYE